MRWMRDRRKSLHKSSIEVPAGSGLVGKEVLNQRLRQLTREPGCMSRIPTITRRRRSPAGPDAARRSAIPVKSKCWPSLGKSTAGVSNPDSRPIATDARGAGFVNRVRWVNRPITVRQGIETGRRWPRASGQQRQPGGQQGVKAIGVDRCHEPGIRPAPGDAPPVDDGHAKGQRAPRLDRDVDFAAGEQRRA